MLNFDSIPNGVDVMIFSYLGIKDLGNCCRVSKNWKTFVSSDIFWKQLLPNLYGANLHSPKQNFKEFLDLHICITEEKVSERLDRFMQKLEKDQTGVFKCYLQGIDTQLLITIKRGAPKNHEISITDTCIFSRDDSPLPKKFKKIVNIKNYINVVPNVSDIMKNTQSYTDLAKLYLPLATPIRMVIDKYDCRERSNYIKNAQATDRYRTIAIFVAGVIAVSFIAKKIFW